MASYTATWVGPPSNPAQEDDVPEAGEAATDPFESWLGWLSEARDAIDEGDGDPEDLDNLLAVILERERRLQSLARDYELEEETEKLC